jgi:dipeptidyl aminopeptidase/acylaminoacyl peptidase
MFRFLLGASFAALLSATAVQAASVEAYGRLPAMEDVEISNDGLKIAYIINAGGVTKVVVQGLDGVVMQVLDMGGQKVRDVTWADNGHVIVQVSQTTGIDGVALVGEYFQALSLNIQTGKSVQLPSGVADSVLNIMQDAPIGGVYGGKPVIWASLYATIANNYQSDSGHLDLYRIDPETGQARLRQVGDSETNGYLTMSDGTILGREKFRSKDGRYRVELRDGGWKEVYSATALIDRPSLLGQTADGSAVVMHLWDDKKQMWRLAPISRTDGKMGDTFGPERPFGVLTDNDQHLIGYSYTDVYQEYEFLEPHLKAAWPKVRQVFAGRQVSLTSFTPDYAKLVVYAEGTGEPGGYYLVDLTANKIKRIGSVYPDLTGADIAQVQAIKYKAADGLELNGYLTLPNGKAPKNLPLIVLPHGGPQSRDTAGFDWWSQALASRGYAVLQVNFRGSSGYGQPFTESAYGEWGGKMQTDLSDGVRTLAKAGTIDPKRVCITGASYGGYAALAGITLDKGVYRCAVAVAGVSDMGKMLDIEISQHGMDSTTVRYWKRYMGADKASDPKLAARSPANFADKADGPVLLIHGKDDTVVAYSQSTDMRHALEKAGKPVEFVTLKAEDHWLSREATRKQMLNATITFLEKNNPPN